MRTFTKSLGRFSWVMSLFGLSGLAELLDGRRRTRPGATAATAFDSASGILEKNLAQPFRFIFLIGDRLLGEMVDFVFAIVPSGSGEAPRRSGEPVNSGPGFPGPDVEGVGGPGAGFPGPDAAGAGGPGAGFPGAGAPWPDPVAGWGDPSGRGGQG